MGLKCPQTILHIKTYTGLNQTYNGIEITTGVAIKDTIPD